MRTGTEPDPGAAAAVPAEITAEQWDRLAPRERQVYELRAAGHSYPDIARIAGMKESSARTYYRDARRKLGRPANLPPGDVPGELEIPGARVPMAQFLAQIEQKAKLALQAMDRKRFEKANLRDASQAVKDLFHVRSLILGEPTQIIRTEERASLDEAVRMIVAEAQRRGFAITTDIESGGVQIARRPRTVDAEVSPG